MQTDQLLKRQQTLKKQTVVRGVSLPKALDVRLVEQAQQEDRPISRIIRKALILYLNQGDNGGESGHEK